MAIKIISKHDLTKYCSVKNVYKTLILPVNILYVSMMMISSLSSSFFFSYVVSKVSKVLFRYSKCTTKKIYLNLVNKL